MRHVSGHFETTICHRGSHCSSNPVLARTLVDSVAVRPISKPRRVPMHCAVNARIATIGAVPHRRLVCPMPVSDKSRCVKRMDEECCCCCCCCCKASAMDLQPRGPILGLWDTALATRVSQSHFQNIRTVILDHRLIAQPSFLRERC